MDPEQDSTNPSLKRTVSLTIREDIENESSSGRHDSTSAKRAKTSESYPSGMSQGDEDDTYSASDDSVNSELDVNLAIALDEKSRSEMLADMDLVIQQWEKTINSHPIGHPSRAQHLEACLLAMQERYSATQTTADLERQIKFAQQAVEEAPLEFKPAAFANLSIALHQRFSHLGIGSDLEKAEKYARDACATTPAGHPLMIKRLAALSDILGDKYPRTDDPADLDEAIEVARSATKLPCDDKVTAAAAWATLSDLLQARCESADPATKTDLQDAIDAARKALDLSPNIAMERASRLNSLGTALGNMFLETEEERYLHEAIAYLELAVQGTRDESPDKSMWLYNLGCRLLNKHAITQEDVDVNKAMECHKEALHNLNAPNLHRILAGEAILLHSPDWDEAYEAAKLAIDLIPKLTSWSLDSSDKQQLLSRLYGLASCGATAALRADKGSVAALRLLEQGRGVLIASLQAMQLDMMELQAEQPELYERLKRHRDDVTTQLETGTSQFDHRYEAGKALDQVIDQIRAIPGYEGFLLPPSEAEMLGAANHGPIVVINVSEWECNAFLITQDQIRDLDLEVSVEKINEMAKRTDLSNPVVLRWLWDAIAEPILEALGFHGPPLGEDWPRMWWIPTGPLSKFPFHAAGYHNQPSASNSVLDRVISSYSVSIQTMIIQQKRHRPGAVGPSQALLVAMEHTPGYSSLPYTTREIGMVRDFCQTLDLDPVQPQRRRQDILSALPDCKIFHFAGHGSTNSRDPMQSYLCLEPDEADNNGDLTVADIMALRLGARGTFLAYLSACGTGRIQEDKFVDESIHLVSACQLAGFPHVVGTLWDVNDETCVHMAKRMYEEIGRRGMTDESVCRGLHLATRELRHQWLESQTNVPSLPKLREGDEGVVAGEVGPREGRLALLYGAKKPGSALLWVPYVHFGA